ncbi:MAG TPA: hypothetical protein VHC23_00835 [Jatrophihabitans sp.]|nr:hypothetical protein [Jatrophihabitans sp.]
MSGIGRLGPEFDDFVRDSGSGLLQLAVLLTRDRGRAEGLVQVALLRTARRWGAARHNRVAYSRRVLVNLTEDGWRQRGRRPQEVSDLTGIDPVAYLVVDLARPWRAHPCPPTRLETFRARPGASLVGAPKGGS